MSEINRWDLQTIAGTDNTISYSELNQAENTELAKTIQKAYKDSWKKVDMYLNDRVSEIETILKEQWHTIVENMKNYNDTKNIVIEETIVKKKTLKKDTDKKASEKKKSVEKKDTNEFNYSTEKEPALKNSVEDIVETATLWDETKIKETVKNLKNLKVDIYNPKSHLIVRDENGKQMWADWKPLQLGEWTKLDPKYTWNSKLFEYKWKNRLFLEIKLSDWKTWYIAAKYVNWELLKDILKEPADEEKKKTTDEEKKKTTDEEKKKTTGEEKKKTTGEEKKKTTGEEKKKTTGEPVTPPTPPIDNSVEIWDKEFSPVFTRTKEGLQHDNQNQWEISEELTQEEIEKLQQNYSDYTIMKDIVDIWIDAARKEASSEMFEIFKSESLFGKSDTKVINEQIWKIQNLMIILAYKIKAWEKIEHNEFTKIFNEMKIAENTEDILDNFEDIKWEFAFERTNEKAKKLKRETILKLMRTRYGWITEWNSKLVTSKMWNILLEKTDFKDIKKIISDPNTIALIESDSKTKLIALWIPRDLVEELTEKYWEIKNIQTNNIETFREAVRNEQPWLESSNTTDFNSAVKTKIEFATNSSIKELLKQWLLFNKLDKNESLENKYADYSDMVWVGYTTFSDENTAHAVEIWLILATSVVLIWAGVKVAQWAGKIVNWAGKWINAFAKWSKLDTAIINLAAKWPKYAKIANWLRTIPKGIWIGLEKITQWVTFYQTSNVLHNVMFEKHFENIGKWWDDSLEMAKAVAFFWVMWAFSKYWVQIQKLSNKVPSNVLKKSLPILVEAGAIVTSWELVEMWYEWFTGKELNNHLTWAEYIEALIMVWVMKTKLPNFKRNPKIPKFNNKLVDWQASTPVNFYKDPVSWKTYTKTLDWKFINWKWKEVKLSKKKIESLEKFKKQIEFYKQKIEQIDKSIKRIESSWKHSPEKKKELISKLKRIRHNYDLKLQMKWEKYTKVVKVKENEKTISNKNKKRLEEERAKKEEELANSKKVEDDWEYWLSEINHNKPKVSEWTEPNSNNKKDI